MILLRMLYAFLLLSPVLTIIHFQYLRDSTLILVQMIILTPFVIACVGAPYCFKVLSKNSHKNIVYLMLVIFVFTVVGFGRTISDFTESLIMVVRIFSCGALFLIGSYLRDTFLTYNVQAKLISYGIVGGALGIVAYYLTIEFGFRMTHSVTADGMIAPLVWKSVWSSSGKYWLLACFPLVLLSGKSANLVALVASFALVSFSKRYAYIALGVIGTLLFVFYFVPYENYIPTKLAYRINILRAVLSGEVLLDSSLGSRLTAGRYDEIIGLLEKWSANVFSFIFGSGLATFTSIDLYESRSTIHMSYMKIVDMVGILGFLPFLYCFIISVVLSLKFVSNKKLALYSFFVTTQIVLAFFQFTVLQDPMYWIAFGVLFAASRPGRSDHVRK